MTEKLSDYDFLDLIVELAQQVESSDSISWDMFPADEETLYKYAGTQIIDNMNLITDKDDKIIMLLAVALKLTVENTVLNYQPIQQSMSK